VGAAEVKSREEPHKKMSPKEL